MKMQKVSSSNINSIGYNEPLKQLNVEFKSGKTFAYTGVTAEEFSALKAAESVGKHFIQEVKYAKDSFEVKEGWAEELIAKQDEQIKFLRDALKKIAEPDHEIDLSCRVLGIVNDALTVTAKGGRHAL